MEIYNGKYTLAKGHDILLPISAFHLEHYSSCNGQQKGMAIKPIND